MLIHGFIGSAFDGEIGCLHTTYFPLRHVDILVIVLGRPFDSPDQFRGERRSMNGPPFVDEVTQWTGERLLAVDHIVTLQPSAV